MVAQLLVLFGTILALLCGGLIYLVHRALRDMRQLAESALLAGKATSARDLAEAESYAKDTELTRRLSEIADGPAIASVSPPDPVYRTADGHELTVLKPFM